MTKFSTGLAVLALATGLGSFTASAWAQDDGQETDAPATAAGAVEEQKSFIEKLEDDLKEATTPTDVETDAIGTAEDADRDLY